MFEPETPGEPRPLSSATQTAATPVHPIPDAVAPSELAPVPTKWERFAWYAGTVVLSTVLICAGLRLDRADLRAPFYYDLDSLLILPMVKCTVERGFGGHWVNPRMGAPGEQELYDFPVIDHLHFALIWFFGQFISDLALLYNFYFLLTFPLTALTGMIVFRHLGLSLPAAAVGGVLYSFMPYHYNRWENHYFLAAYWVVPLSLLPVFALFPGEVPFFRREAGGAYKWNLRTRATAWQVALAAATASAGAYYAFFACALIGFAGAYAWLRLGTHPAMLSAAVAAGLVVFFGLINHAPTFVYQSRYDVNPVTLRAPDDADVYGMKVSQLLLPCEEHNFRLFRGVKSIYNTPTRPSENENRASSLGLIASAGLLGLWASLVLPFRRAGWPFGPLAAVTLFIVLFANVGGFGTIFNLLVTSSIRCHNRMSIFLAFFCLLAALWVVDRFLLTRTGPARRLRYPAWGLLLLVGFADQTPNSWFRSGITKTLDEQGRRFRADARFFGQIEERVPGGKVFCLPYIPYPEVPELHKMPTYDHARGYVHTGTVSWSYGSMKGREADAWDCDVATPLHKEMVREMLKRIVARGFDGLFIDARGFREGPGARVTAKEVRAEINEAYALLTSRKVAQLPEIVHESGNQFFLDLRPYRDLYAEAYPDAFAKLVTREQEWVAVLWLGGFVGSDVFSTSQDYRDGPPDARAWFINPSDRTRTFRVSMGFQVYGKGSYQFRLSGLVDDAFEKDKEGRTVKQYEVKVPPGRHVVRFQCTPPPDYIHIDHRKLCYAIRDFKMEEVR